MNKQALRQEYKAKRKELSANEIENLSIEIANNVLKMAIWDKKYYHLFLPIVVQKEVDTHFLLTILQGKDKEIVVSKSDFETTTMHHYLLTDSTKFIENQYHILEPVEGIQVPVSMIDVVFVPLLCYDKLGNRIGYGKGFYDQFLASCPAATIKIGLSFFDPEEIKIISESTDIKLDYCITPNEIHKFIK